MCATWSETSQVHIWNMAGMLEAVEDSRALRAFNQESDSVKPIFTFKGHSSEGFAIDWAKTMPGNYWEVLYKFKKLKLYHFSVSF